MNIFVKVLSLLCLAVAGFVLFDSYRKPMLTQEHSRVGAWLVFSFFLLCALIIWFENQIAAWVTRVNPNVETLSMDEQGLVREWGSKRGAKRSEIIAWADLDRVLIQTTDEGPAANDFFYLLLDGNAKGVLVHADLAQEHKLLEVLQARLAGFDNETFLQACSSTEDALFTVWRRTDPPPSPSPKPQ